MTEKKIDREGRILIPESYRKELKIKTGDSMEVETTDGKIILKPKMEKCFICNSETDILTIDNFKVCLNCIKKLQKIKL